MKTFIFPMRALCALLSPPYVRDQHLLEVQSPQLRAKVPLMAERLEQILRHGMYLPDTTTFGSLAILLPPRFDSQGIILQLTREHNLWELSLRSPHASSKDLPAILQFNDHKHASKQCKRFVRDLIKRGRLRARVINLPHETSFEVRFLGADHIAQGQDKLELMLETIDRLIPGPTCLKVANKRKTESNPHPSSLKRLSEHIWPEKAKRPRTSLADSPNDTAVFSPLMTESTLHHSNQHLNHIQKSVSGYVEMFEVTSDVS